MKNLRSDHVVTSSVTTRTEISTLVIAEPRRPWSSFYFELNRQPQSLFHELAYPRFAYDFLISTDPTEKPGPLELINQAYARASLDSFLYSAVNAVSLANFAARFKCSEAKTAALEQYTLAVRRLADSASNPDILKSSEALLSGFVLGLYEVIHILSTLLILC
jgi:hypothetical protein